MKRPNPEDVFTPASAVQEDMYASRRHANLEERLNAALNEKGRQVVLYGDTGVGKTSLVNHLARTRKIKMVRIECAGTLDEMMDAALAGVVKRREVTTTQKESVEGATKASAVVIEGTVTGVKGTDILLEPVPVSRSQETIPALEEAGIRVLFIDNYENLSGTRHEKETSRAIAQLLKSVSDRADATPNALKIVVAGIPSSSEALIHLDEATARRTAQVPVERMPQEELAVILDKGEEKLGISFQGLARHLILEYSDGFPYYTHLLALHAARRVIKTGGDTVNLADFDEGLESILADCDLSLRTAYQRAVETTGDVKARKSIMEALASLQETEVPFKQIRLAFLKSHPAYGDDPNKLNFLSTAIKPLKEDLGILVDRNLPKSTKNLYRFKNPLMRAYVRLQMRREGTAAPAIWDPMATYVEEPPDSPRGLIERIFGS